MLKLLVVDDSVIQRTKVKNLLLSFHYEVLEAASGDEALKYLENNRPDCVLTDLLMPGMSGQDFIRQLKENRNSTPVIVMTADIQDSTRKQCLELGAAAIINKPFSGDQLMEALKTVFLNERA